MKHFQPYNLFTNNTMAMATKYRVYVSNLSISLSKRSFSSLIPFNSIKQHAIALQQYKFQNTYVYPMLLMNKDGIGIIQDLKNNTIKNKIIKHNKKKNNNNDNDKNNKIIKNKQDFSIRKINKMFTPLSMPDFKAPHLERIRQEREAEEDKQIPKNLAYHISKKDFVNHQALIVMTEDIKQQYAKNQDQPTEEYVIINAFINITKDLTEIEFANKIRKSLTVIINQTFVDYPHKYYNMYHFQLNCILTYDSNTKPFVRRNYSQFILNKIPTDIRDGLSSLESIFLGYSDIINNAIKTSPHKRTLEQTVLAELGDCYTSYIADKINVEFSPISLLPPPKQQIDWYKFQIKLICDEISRDYVRRPTTIILDKCYLLDPCNIITPLRPIAKLAYRKGFDLIKYVFINITLQELEKRIIEKNPSYVAAEAVRQRR